MYLPPDVLSRPGEASEQESELNEQLNRALTDARSTSNEVARTAKEWREDLKQSVLQPVNMASVGGEHKTTIGVGIAAAQAAASDIQRRRTGRQRVPLLVEVMQLQASVDEFNQHVFTEQGGQESLEAHANEMLKHLSVLSPGETEYDELAHEVAETIREIRTQTEELGQKLGRLFSPPSISQRKNICRQNSKEYCTLPCEWTERTGIRNLFKSGSCDLPAEAMYDGTLLRRHPSTLSKIENQAHTAHLPRRSSQTRHHQYSTSRTRVR